MTQFFRKYDFLYLVIVASIPFGLSISSALTLVPTFCIFWKLFEFVKEYDEISTQLRQLAKEDDMDNIVSEFELDGEPMIIKKTVDGIYNVYHGDRLVQPNHNADGVIRYLSMIAHNQDYIIKKEIK